MQSLKVSTAGVLRGSIREDLYAVLSAFFQQDNLALCAFKRCWQQCKTSLIHHACPSHIDYDSYLQMCGEVLQTMLFQPPPEQHLPAPGAAAPASHKTAAKSFAVVPLPPTHLTFTQLWMLRSLSARSAAWNAGVVYALYLLHRTQPGPANIVRRDGRPMIPPAPLLPIRVSPAGLSALVLVSAQLLVWQMTCAYVLGPGPGPGPALRVSRAANG